MSIKTLPRPFSSAWTAQYSKGLGGLWTGAEGVWGLNNTGHAGYLALLAQYLLNGTMTNISLTGKVILHCRSSCLPAVGLFYIIWNTYDICKMVWYEQHQCATSEPQVTKTTIETLHTCVEKGITICLESILYSSNQGECNNDEIQAITTPIRLTYFSRKLQCIRTARWDYHISTSAVQYNWYLGSTKNT